MKLFINSLTIKGWQTFVSESLYKRIGSLILTVIAISIAVNLWLLSNHHAQNWHTNQAAQLGRSLGQQAALSLVSALSSDNQEIIKQRLQDLLSDPHISQASIYDQRGRLLASTSENHSVVAQFKTAQQQPLVFISEIKRQEKIIGYLRLYLLEQQVMRHHYVYQQQLLQQLLLVMIFIAVIAILMTRAYYQRQSCPPQQSQRPS